MVLFIEHKGDTWIAKPDRPFGRLQLDLYVNAFKLDEEMFGCSLELEEIDSRTYVSKKSWTNLVDKLRTLDALALEKITQERQESTRNLIEQASQFPLSREGLERILSIYERTVSFFHFRWNLGKIVEERLKEHLKPLPAAFKMRWVNILDEQREAETVLEGKYIEETARIIRENPSYHKLFFSGDGALVEDVRKFPELWQRIAFWAEEYMHVHNEDIRIEIPYKEAVENLRKKVHSNSCPMPFSKAKKISQDEVRKYIPEWDTFYRILKVAYIQGMQKEDEHHLQIRGQNRMKKGLDILSSSLVESGYLPSKNEIYETPKQKLIEIVGGTENVR